MANKKNKHIDDIKEGIKEIICKSAYQKSQENPDVPIDVIINQVFLNVLKKACSYKKTLYKKKKSKSKKSEDK